MTRTPALLPHHRRHLRPRDVQVPGDCRSGEREPERGLSEAVQHHRHDAVELPGHLLHARVGLGDEDRASEVAAEDDVADHPARRRPTGSRAAPAAR